MASVLNMYALKLCNVTADNVTIHYVYHCSYSLYEPNHTVLREYKGGLEKAILRNIGSQLREAYISNSLRHAHIISAWN